MATPFPLKLLCSASRELTLFKVSLWHPCLVGRLCDGGQSCSKDASCSTRAQCLLNDQHPRWLADCYPPDSGVYTQGIHCPRRWPSLCVCVWGGQAAAECTQKMSSWTSLVGDEGWWGLLLPPAVFGVFISCLGGYFKAAAARTNKWLMIPGHPHLGPEHQLQLDVRPQSCEILSFTRCLKGSMPSPCPVSLCPLISFPRSSCSLFQRHSNRQLTLSQGPGLLCLGGDESEAQFVREAPAGSNKVWWSWASDSQETSHWKGYKETWDGVHYIMGFNEAWGQGSLPPPPGRGERGVRALTKFDCLNHVLISESREILRNLSLTWLSGGISKGKTWYPIRVTQRTFLP